MMFSCLKFPRWDLPLFLYLSSFKFAPMASAFLYFADLAEQTYGACRFDWYLFGFGEPHGFSHGVNISELKAGFQSTNSLKYLQYAEYLISI